MPRCYVFLTALVLSFTPSLHAQEAAYTRHEVAIGYSTYPTAPLMRYDYNLSPSLALETSLTGLPSPPFNESDTMHLTAGVKAGLRRGRWNFFGTIAPGWSLSPDTEFHEQATVNGSTTVVTITSRRPIERSQFLLTTGGGIEFSATPRTFFRAEIDSVIKPVFSQTILPETLTPGGGISDATIGEIRSSGNVSFTVGHRFGVLLHEPDKPTAAPRIEAGAFFSLLGHTPQLTSDTTVDPGVGGWISASLGTHIDAEVAGFYAPHSDFTSDVQDGGKRSAIFAGFKTGFRRDHFGMFAKARGGAMRYSQTFAGSSYPTYEAYFSDYLGHATWQPALDLGGVVEVYPVRHLVLRAEAGPTIVFLRQTTFSVAGDSGTVPGTHVSNMLLLFGGGLRF